MIQFWNWSVDDGFNSFTTLVPAYFNQRCALSTRKAAVKTKGSLRTDFGIDTFLLFSPNLLILS